MGGDSTPPPCWGGAKCVLLALGCSLGQVGPGWAQNCDERKAAREPPRVPTTAAKLNCFESNRASKLQTLASAASQLGLPAVSHSRGE